MGFTVRSFLLALLVVFQPAMSCPGQDLEPSLNRAAALLAGRLVDELPIIARGESITALSVAADGPVSGEGATCLASALAQSGFDVVRESPLRRPGVLPLMVRVEGSEPHRRLVMQVRPRAGGGHGALQLVCGFGDASWADDDGDGAIFVTGPWRTDPDAAVEAVKALARRRVLARLGNDRSRGEGIDALGHLAYRTFVGSADRNGVRVHRAFMRVEWTESASERVGDLARQVERRRAAIPWLRLAGTALMGVLALLAYLGSDLKTNGYKTRRLQVLFGTLFVLGAGLCWRLPL